MNIPHNSKRIAATDLYFSLHMATQILGLRAIILWYSVALGALGNFPGSHFFTVTHFEFLCLAACFY